MEFVSRCLAGLTGLRNGMNSSGVFLRRVTARQRYPITWSACQAVPVAVASIAVQGRLKSTAHLIPVLAGSEPKHVGIKWIVRILHDRAARRCRHIQAGLGYQSQTRKKSSSTPRLHRSVNTMM